MRSHVAEGSCDTSFKLGKMAIRLSSKHIEWTILHNFTLMYDDDAIAFLDSRHTMCNYD